MPAIASDLLKRLVGLICILLGVLIITFTIPYLVPGGPERALIGWPYTAERATILRTHYGFEQPFYEQFGLWVYHAVTGEWGRSKFTGRPVMQEVASSLPLTLKLLGEAVCLSVLIGSVCALLAISPWSRPYSHRGRGLWAVMAGFPDFYFGILMKFFFVWHLEWFPVNGLTFFAERPWHAYAQLLLPALSVAVLYGIIVGPRVATRLVATYDRARTKADHAGDIRPVHSGRLFASALGHSLIVVLQSGTWLLGSVMLAEKVFTIPGFGDFGIEAFVRHDYPKIQVFIFAMVGGFATLRAVVDMIEATRIRHLRSSRTDLSDEPPAKDLGGVGGLMMQDGFFLGAVLVLALVASTVLASYIAPYLPDEVHMKDRLQPPTTHYWMGSDLLGRDILSRVLHGGRHCLMVAGLSATGAVLLAALIGGVPPFMGPTSVALVSPVVRLLAAFPALIIGLLMMTLLGQGHWQETIGLTAALTPALAATFLQHAVALRQRQLPSLHRVAAVWLHTCGLAVVLEATLNFLDIGLLPLIPSWGGDLKANLPYLHVNPAIVLFPGMAVVVSAIGFNLMARSLQWQSRLTQSSQQGLCLGLIAPQMWSREASMSQPEARLR